ATISAAIVSYDPTARYLAIVLIRDLRMAFQESRSFFLSYMRPRATPFGKRLPSSFLRRSLPLLNSRAEDGIGVPNWAIRFSRDANGATAPRASAGLFYA